MINEEKNPGSAEAPQLSVLEYLRRELAGTLSADDTTYMRYPTAISRLLGFSIIAVDRGEATLEFSADAAIHGNQQGTVHGGLLAEFADAAIGTAQSTVMNPSESFTSIDLRTTFLRPVWAAQLRAEAYPTHTGRTLTHYACEITREDGKPVARATSMVMTLRGDQATGR